VGAEGEEGVRPLRKTTRGAGTTTLVEPRVRMVGARKRVAMRARGAGEGGVSAGEAWRKPAACRGGVGEEKPRRAGEAWEKVAALSVG
jgi:hypothetical protein